MKRDISVLIIHAHWSNRGDEAAIRAMIDSLRLHLPIRTMEIMILGENVVNFPYDDIKIVEAYPYGLLQMADCFLTLFSRGRISMTKSGIKFLEAVDKADVVIHAPGGPSIGDIYRGGYWSYTYLYRLFFSRVVKRKPIFFYAPSMGPFTHKFDNLLRRFILKRADVIVLREDISGKYLEEQLDLKSIVTCDSALQNSVEADYIQRYGNLGLVTEFIENNQVVGITITDLRWHPVHGKNPCLENRISASIHETIESLIGKGYCILLIPQVFGSYSDVPLLQEYRDPDPERILILPDNIDSYGQQVLISRLHSVIGMRYHSNVFAAKSSVPFLSISYEHKMKGFLEKLGLSELVLDVEEITGQEIITKFEHLERNYRQVKSTLDSRIPELRELSGTTTEIIATRIRQIYQTI